MEIPKKPNNAPESCPGTESNRAGKEDACNGCPNKKICSTPKDPSKVLEEDKIRQILASKMAQIKHKILVLSGKGGVGKTTTARLIAFCSSRTLPGQ